MTGPASRWIQRLARFAALTVEEQGVLEDAATATHNCTATDNIVNAGDRADHLVVVLGGLAYQYKLLSDDRRQIVAYLFAGDMCDPRELLQPRVDYSICLLRPAETTSLSLSSIERLERYPNVALAMSRYALAQGAIMREWLVNVGHRTAFERVGHLICEVHARLESVGLTRAHAFELALTQAEIGDTVALSAVHVNRTLMELRRLKLVTFQNRRVLIHDYAALRAAAGFDPAYLHFDDAPALAS